MNITDIKVRRIIDGAGKLKGIVSITLDGVLAVHDIKVVQGEDRLFVAMPSRRDEHGMYRDIVHPISPDSRLQIEESILSAYRTERDRRSAEEQLN